jgi:O-antigen ligase
MSVRFVARDPRTLRTSPPHVKNAGQVRVGDAAPAGWIAEASLAVVILLVVALLRSISKFTFTDSPEDSSVGLLAWGSMYVFAACRLYAMRVRAMQIARRSRALIAFLAIIALSVLWSAAYLVTLRDTIELLGTSLVAWYLVTRFTLSQFLQIAAVVFVIISVSSIAMVVGSPARGRMDWGTGSMSGVLPEKNALGAAMALTCFTVVLLALHAKTWRTRIALALAALLSGGLLIGSNSITAAIFGAATVGIVIVAWGVSRKQYGAVIAMLFVAVTVPIVVFGVFGTDIATLFEAIGRNSNLTGRADLYPLLLDAVRDRPLLGFGYDSFFKSEALVPDLADFIALINWTPPHAHNSFLQITLDTGIAGLCIFLVVLGTALKRAIDKLSRGGRAIDFWPFAVIVFLTLGSYDETYFAQANTIEWILFLAAALYPIRESPADETKPVVPVRKLVRSSR